MDYNHEKIKNFFFNIEGLLGHSLEEQRSKVRISFGFQKYDLHFRKGFLNGKLDRFISFCFRASLRRVKQKLFLARLCDLIITIIFNDDLHFKCPESIVLWKLLLIWVYFIMATIHPYHVKFDTSFSFRLVLLKAYLTIHNGIPNATLSINNMIYNKILYGLIDLNRIMGY